MGEEVDEVELEVTDDTSDVVVVSPPGRTFGVEKADVDSALVATSEVAAVVLGATVLAGVV